MSRRLADAERALESVHETAAFVAADGPTEVERFAETTDDQAVRERALAVRDRVTALRRAAWEGAVPTVTSSLDRAVTDSRDRTVTSSTDPTGFSPPGEKE